MLKLINVKIFEQKEPSFYLHDKRNLIVDSMYILSTENKSVIQPLFDILKQEKIKISHKAFLIIINSEDDYSSPKEYFLKFDELNNVKEFRISGAHFTDIVNYEGVVKI